jgi:hypothetical protein
MEIGFDVISDLHLSPDENFNWENKATSLYCLIPGNISSDTRTTIQTLAHLSRYYQGIFITLGTTDYENISDYSARTKHLLQTYNSIGKVAVLHHHVVIIDGVAIAGINGWENSNDSLLANRMDDLSYVSQAVSKLQRHLDVKKIVILSNAVPKEELYFGEQPKYGEPEFYLDFSLRNDTEKKISHWVYGSYNKNVDTVIEGVNYVNNSYYKRRPYWPKRINVTF